MSERASFITRPDGVCSACLAALTKHLEGCPGVSWLVIPGSRHYEPSHIMGSLKIEAYDLHDFSVRSMLVGIEPHLCHTLDLIVVPENYETAGVSHVSIDPEA